MQKSSQNTRVFYHILVTTLFSGIVMPLFVPGLHFKSQVISRMLSKFKVQPGAKGQATNKS